MDQYSEAAADYDAPCIAAKPGPHPLDTAAESGLLADSALLGWSDAYASITTRRAWVGRVTPHEHYGLLYYLRGCNRVERRLDGEPAPLRVVLQARQMSLLPTRTPAHLRIEGDADVLAIYLRAAMVRAIADRLFGASTRPLHFQPRMAFSDPLLEQICLTFADALNSQRLGGGRYMDMLAESAAAHCLIRYGAGRPQAGEEVAGRTEMETALGRVRAYVDDHLDGDLCVETLAEEAALSPSALKRAFALVHGETPRQWVIRRRIAHAQKMLAATDLPLVEVALRAGFSSQSHLTTMFKREVGRTPMSYRRAE